jgi:hypothetical protein
VNQVLAFALTAVLGLAALGCANSITSDTATVAPSPDGIPQIQDLGINPIQMQKSDTLYTIAFPKIEVLSKSPGYSDIPDGQVLVVLDVVYEVQSGSLDVVSDTDFEAYADGVEAVESASFGYGLEDIGYVTLLAGTKAKGQFGYLAPSSSKTLVLFFVDQFADEPKIWQMNIPIAPGTGSSDADIEEAVLSLWADGAGAANAGNLSAAYWEIDTAYPGSLNPTKSKSCADALASNRSLGSILSFTGDFTTVVMEPDWAPQKVSRTDELSLKAPLAGEIFSMIVNLRSKNAIGTEEEFSERIHMAVLDGKAYRFPAGFCQ